MCKLKKRMISGEKQLCIATSWITNYSIFPAIYYPLQQHLHCAQPIIQILLTVNRMSCVLHPWKYSQSIFAFQVVRTSTNISYFLLPISWDILNVGTPIVMVLASSQLRKHVFGNFKRSRSNSKVEDARSTFFFAVLRGISVIFIGISTLITVIKMSKMQKRMKESERKLCWASIYLSICYVTPAITEYQFSQTYTILPNDHYLYGLTLITWDIQNIGSTFVMLIVNAPFRKYFFDFSKKKSDGIEAKKAHIIAILSLTH
ncbi:hypothetical protein L3Y34_000572 [Caenorhabditis briggsae]|uniref:Serpentine receptor class gamma n=1 Tax=Caenorhabditis briggsae TaxID=6238 RepID=A0AAE9D9Q7_CAEBR|nr:hypothetical protein L3Y34_000572 [Caenorhabditis briggsae]